MNQWIVLLRGVNVGGKNKLKMAELRTSLSAAGFERVQTHIQSGNVVVTAPDDLSRSAVKDRIKDVLHKAHDIDASVMVMSPQNLRRAAKDNPLEDVLDKPNWMFAMFLRCEPCEPNLSALEVLKSENETFALGQGVFYFYAGDGAARSKLMARAERHLGVPGTARNWNTVRKLIEMTEISDE